MKGNKKNIWVYADWLGMESPKCIGILSVQQGKGKQAFSFEYDKSFLNTKEQLLLDPDIGWYLGSQFPDGKENFGIFLDSMPDTWGRTLMKRREAQIAKTNNEKPKILYDTDYLLGVYDESRMGALRFKLDKDGPFLDDNQEFPTPPWSSIRELQHGISILESSENELEISKWLSILIAPGSSLGGARPKANILDNQKHLWIAKFPSKNDIINKGAWEYLAYKLAIGAGIEMSESKIEKISRQYHTFFTKRFDRYDGKRIHFASAMTMTGNNETFIKDKSPSYLEIAEFIQNYGSDIKKDLHQLWRRIIFNIAISNTDDHLRNHGFIIKNNEWRLSPAFDINPSIDKDGLTLNIDLIDNSLDFELAKGVGEYFQLSKIEMQQILDDVLNAVSRWRDLANKIGIPRSEQILMEAAFYK
ncbi:MAG: HipA domain-containing protein [Ignavibacteria bacterium]|nr:HipA domain-containing protein [Ignavibacteria bacterium]